MLQTPDAHHVGLQIQPLPFEPRRVIAEAMRFINVDTFELEEFMDHRSTNYAILSHTWGQKEVTFADMQRGLPHAEALPSFEKIRGACRQAAIDGFKFVWVDTCCIDKSSSAELSEAINSMFRWYADAKICYAYLSDVEEVGEGFEAESQFRKSRWFTRGWTLQELLAPKKVIFYSHKWIGLGSKEEFATMISEIAGIDYEALRVLDITRFSVAERMSWASGRVTTRQEDIAYCLLGLFGVNMPLLYGEGERAFIRLEEEIIKRSDDHSIFAWTSSSDAPYMTSGLLATSPLQFKHSGRIDSFRGATDQSRPYLMTNKGLSIKMNLLKGNGPQEYFAVLDCCTMDRWILAICLRETVYSPDKTRFSPGESACDQFIRVRCDELYALSSTSYDGSVELFVRQKNMLSPATYAVNTRGATAFKLDEVSPSFVLDRVCQYAPNDYNLHRKEKMMACIYGHDGGILVDIPNSVNDWVGIAIFRSTTSSAAVWVMLGWTFKFGVSVHVCEGYEENSNGDILEVALRPQRMMKKVIQYQDWDPEFKTKTGCYPCVRATQHATAKGPTTPYTMDTQRPPKKTARVYGKKKQVSKSAGIFLQDSSPAPQKGGGRVEEEKEVEKTVTTAEVESRNEGNDNEKPVRRSTRKSSPVKSDSNAEPGLDARADANATPRKLKSSRKKKKKTDTKESDNVDNEPAAVAHKEPKAPKSPAKSPTKAKAASDPDVLADLTQTLNALQIAPTSPPATQPPPSKTHRARRPRTSGVPP
ncbi:hypothetical protein V495_01053, partial [Pseudogymnoascus sp. VKM F-4514 (FW-929)]